MSEKTEYRLLLEDIAIAISVETKMEDFEYPRPHHSKTVDKPDRQLRDEVMRRIGEMWTWRQEDRIPYTEFGLNQRKYNDI